MFFEYLSQTDREPMTVYQILRSASYDEGVEQPASYLIENYSNQLFLNTSGDYGIYDRDDSTALLSSSAFQQMIATHYLKRRIGFNTLTEFRFALEAKYQDIYPVIRDKLYIINQNYNALVNGASYSESTSDTNTTTKSGEITKTTDYDRDGVIYHYKDRTATIGRHNYVNHTESYTKTTTGSSNSSDNASSENTTTLNKSDTTTNKYGDTPQSNLSDSGLAHYASEYDTNTLTGTDTTTGSTSGESSNNVTTTTTDTHSDSYTENASGVGSDNEWQSWYDLTSKGKSMEYTGTITGSGSGAKTYTNTKYKTDPDTYKKIYDLFNKSIFDWWEYVFKELDDLFLSVF